MKNDQIRRHSLPFVLHAQGGGSKSHTISAVCASVFFQHCIQSCLRISINKCQFHYAQSVCNLRATLNLKKCASVTINSIFSIRFISHDLLSSAVVCCCFVKEKVLHVASGDSDSSGSGFLVFWFSLCCEVQVYNNCILSYLQFGFSTKWHKAADPKLSAEKILENYVYSVVLILCTFTH